MNSQNRMNAGAEYVAYRIWATLQDERGIHPESLLACLGALAGYACQDCVRKTSTLRTSDALNVPLIESPLSVWSLVGLAVRKVGAPLPDIQNILGHVTQTVGTSAFGVPRTPEEHQPDHLPIVYLKQLWPQILPIVKRFCSRPMQVPVLFGIAIQRAIEQTQHALNPTIGASIAMESAVAMSKAMLPLFDTTENAERLTAELPPPDVIRADVIRATPPRKRRNSEREADAPSIRAFAARVPPAARIVMIMSVAFITVATVMHEPYRPSVQVKPAIEAGARFEGNTRVAEASLQPADTFEQDGAAELQELPPVEEAPTAAEEAQFAAADMPPPQPVAEPMPEEVPQPYSDGMDEMVIRE